MQDKLQELLQKERQLSEHDEDRADKIPIVGQLRNDLGELVQTRKEYLTRCEEYHKRIANIGHGLDVVNNGSVQSLSPIQLQISTLQVCFDEFRRLKISGGIRSFHTQEL